MMSRGPCFTRSEGELRLSFFTIFEFRVHLFVAEFGLGVRCAVGDDFVVDLSLDLAIENLELFVFQFCQIFRKRIGRSDPQVIRHGVPFEGGAPEIGDPRSEQCTPRPVSSSNNGH